MKENIHNLKITFVYIKMQKVVTHDGCFHTDEVLACMLLDILFNGVEIIRTRDETFMESIFENNVDKTIFVDVGGRYDGELYFDHHQYPDESGESVYWESNYKIPLSSAGMIWKHFGIRIINHLFPGNNLTQSDRIEIRNKMYNSFFLEIDANDNGIGQFPPGEGQKKRFGVHTTLIGTVGRFNAVNVYDNDAQYEKFIEAMDFSEKMFIVHIESYVLAQCRSVYGTEKMLEYYENRLENGAILVLEEDITGWRAILRKIDVDNDIIYIVYPKSDRWGVRTIPKSGFEARKDLADEEYIRSIVGDDLEFQHKKKFMATCKTRESAIKCAVASLHYGTKSEFKDDDINS